MTEQEYINMQIYVSLINAKDVLHDADALYVDDLPDEIRDKLIIAKANISHVAEYFCKERINIKEDESSNVWTKRYFGKEK